MQHCPVKMVSSEKLAVARYLRSKGKTWAEVADEVKVPLTTLYKAVTRKPKKRQANKAQTRCIKQRRKWVVAIADEMETFSMRPGKTARAAARVITRRKFNTAFKIARELQRRHGLTVCRQTILNDCKAEGLGAYVCPWGPIRKQHDQACRLRLCNELLESYFPWEKYVFVDEKYANAIEHGRRTEIRRKGDAASHRQKERFTPTVHVWGAIAVGFRMLVILPKEGIDAPKYKRLCLMKLAPHILEQGFKLVQDGAKPHQAEARQYLVNKGIDVCSWEARSPDLSPIERIWAWIQWQVSKRSPPPANEEEVAQAWQEEWDAIPQRSIDQLCMEFEAYLQECKALEGRTIVSSRAMKKKWQPWRAETGNFVPRPRV